MFASFWNRNHAIRTLQRVAKKYHSMVEAEKKDVFASTAEQLFDLLLSYSKFTSDYRSTLKDTNLNMGQWHSADEYDGQVREITFRCLCVSPMCPPDTAMTEWQHTLLSSDKKSLVDCRWVVVPTSESTCTIDVKVGAQFNKWCVMESKIRSGIINEYKKEVELMLEVARSCIKSNTINDETASVAPCVSTIESNA